MYPLEVEAWVIVVTVDDEPPEHPVITGVVGPFYSSEMAEVWASSKTKKKGTLYTITPLILQY